MNKRAAVFAILCAFYTGHAHAATRPHARIYAATQTSLTLRIYAKPRRPGVTYRVRAATIGYAARTTRIRPLQRRVTLRHLFPGVRYAIRVRACKGRRCARWGRVLYARTKRGDARSLDVPGQPDMSGIPRLGFNDTAYADNHPDDFFGDVHTLGGSIVRRIILWPELEPDSPDPDTTTDAWQRLDRFVDRASKEGDGVTFEIAGTPGWARQYPAGSGLGGAPTTSAWHGLIDLLSTRYPTVKRWGWNEADCCTLDSYIPSSDQITMLASVYQMLHDRIPGVDVMANAGCPCGWAPRQATQVQNIRAFARAEKTRDRFFDTVSLHIYPSLFGRAHGWEPPGSDRALAYETADFGAIVAELDADFRRRVDFHITETGWMSGGGYHGDALNQDCQAAAALWELSQARRYSDRMESFEWFLIRDQPSRDGTNNVYKTGLRFQDGSKKAVYDQWAAYVANPPDATPATCSV